MADSTAKREWVKANTTFVGLKLNNNTDAEIISWLEQQPTKQGAIKEALKDYIKRTASK